MYLLRYYNCIATLSVSVSVPQSGAWAAISKQTEPISCTRCDCRLCFVFLREIFRDNGPQCSSAVLEFSRGSFRFPENRNELSQSQPWSVFVLPKSEFWFWFDWDFLFFVISCGFRRMMNIITMIVLMMHQWGSWQIESDKFVPWQQLSTNFEARLIELYVCECVCVAFRLPFIALSLSLFSFPPPFPPAFHAESRCHLKVINRDK